MYSVVKSEFPLGSGGGAVGDTLQGPGGRVGPSGR